MAKYKYAEIMNPFFNMPDDYADIVKVYRTLAKTADQRLVRLEKYESDENFGNAKQWSYARAQRDIRQWNGENASRFNTAPPESKVDLLAKIRDIQHFLESPTSTRKGIKGILEKRADTLNEKYGTDFKWDSVKKFFDSSLSEKMENKFGSKTVMKMVAYMQQNKDEILKKIEEAEARDVRINNQKLVEKQVDKLIESNGSDIKEWLLSE